MVVTQTVPGLSEIIQRIGGIVPGSGYSLESIKAYTAGWGLITYIPTVARTGTTVTVTYSENSQRNEYRGTFMYFQVISSENTILTLFETDYGYPSYEGTCLYQMSIAFVRGT